MKVIGISASPRQDGNTSIALRTVFEELEKHGIETELIQLEGKAIKGCRACTSCFKNKNNKCVIQDDIVNECIEKMIAADGVILGSPVYFTDVTADMKALVDRIGFVSIANGQLFKRKVGAAVTVLRRGGAFHAIDTMNHFLLYMQMVVPGAGANMVIGREIGEAAADAEGMQNMKTLGENVAWLLNNLKR